MSKKSFIIGIILPFGFAPFFVSAQTADRVLDLTVSAVIATDGTTKVTENIIYDFGGTSHHGIFRNLPTYSSDGGNPRAYGISDIQVTDKEGKVVPFELFDQGTFTRIKIGDPKALVSGVQTYNISYVATALMQEINGTDIWQWDVTSSNWPVAIRRARANITFPKDFLITDLMRSCATVPPDQPNGRESCQVGFLDRTASGTAMSIQFMDPELMQPKESMLLEIGFPKGSFRNIPSVGLVSTTSKPVPPIKVIYTTVLIVAAAVIGKHVLKKKYPKLVKP